VEDNSALIYGLAFGLGSAIIIGIIIGILVYRHYRWKKFLKEAIPKHHFQSSTSNYPITNKYYKRTFPSYSYKSVDSYTPSRMSNDFETDDPDDVSQIMTPSSVSKKNNLTVPKAKSGKINLKSNTGATNC
jgi:ABC-type transport system involved in multi-copper enzyme maturation permease subunit